MANRPKPLILVVDDEPDIRIILRKCLERLDYAVEEAATGAEALTKAMEKRPDGILMDQRLPDFAGYEVHLHLVQLGVRIPTALMSGYPGVDQLARASGIRHFMPKPIAYETVKPFIADLLSPQPR
jgi:two-component system response regulator (stage 0 sporulation protein F)